MGAGTSEYAKLVTTVLITGFTRGMLRATLESEPLSGALGCGPLTGLGYLAATTADTGLSRHILPPASLLRIRGADHLAEGLIIAAVLDPLY